MRHQNFPNRLFSYTKFITEYFIKSKLRETLFFVSIFFGLLYPALGNAFDFARGNAATSIIQPLVVDAVRSELSPRGSDPSTLLRAFVVNSNAWYDAVAPFHPTAVGVFSRLGRRPPSESIDNTKINIAILYASHKALKHLFPARAKQWDKMLLDQGLDPNDNSENETTAVGIGNLAGRKVVEGRANDGLNALGNEGGRLNNLLPYSDYTGYEPVNSAYKLINPSKWQPRVVKVRDGIFQVQQFVTPQYRFVEPYSYKSALDFRVPDPINSNYQNKELYVAQAQNILNESAKLDDRKKMLAEFFDDKILSLGGSGSYLAKKANFGLTESIISNFFTNVAAFDAGIVVWQEKEKYNAVRPYSAIRYLFKNKIVNAYLGPSSGEAGELLGHEWNSYLPTADHPEYPSGTACLCAAHAEFKRKYFGTDKLNFQVTFKPGSSLIEPQRTPRTTISVAFSTWTEFENICGQTRVWGGVHFQSAVDESLRLCPVFGKLAYDYMNGLVSGATEVRPPSRSTIK